MAARLWMKNPKGQTYRVLYGALLLAIRLEDVRKTTVTSIADLRLISQSDVSKLRVTSGKVCAS